MPDSAPKMFHALSLPDRFPDHGPASTLPFFLVRPAGPKDASPLAEIHVQTWKTAYRGIIPDSYLNRLSVENQAERLRLRFLENSGHTNLVLVVGHDLAGWIGGGASRDPDQTGAIEIFALYVSPEYWGSGAGRALLSEFERCHPASSTFALWVLQENLRARSFYEKNGFRPDGAEKLIELGAALPSLRLFKSCYPAPSPAFSP